jgi:hypothetical protein
MFLIRETRPETSDAFKAAQRAKFGAIHARSYVGSVTRLQARNRDASARRDTIGDQNHAS